MSDPKADEASKLLSAWRQGDQVARDRLFELVHGELATISAALLRAERTSSLSTGDLINEAVIRLVGLNDIDWADKAHFLALSARVMRRALIDNARKRNSDKRQHQKMTLITDFVDDSPKRIALDHLEKCLIRLGAIDHGKAEIVELRYFGGLTLEEISEVTGASVSTVKRDWRVARAWLLDAMKETAGDSYRPS